MADVKALELHDIGASALEGLERQRLIAEALASIERDGTISEADMDRFFAETLADLKTR